MPDPLITSSLISAGGSLLGGLFGGGDEFKISPERKRFLEFIREELGKNLGFSTTEKMGLAGKLNRALRERSEKATGSTIASLERRGVGSPGQLAGIASDIQSGAGEAFGRGVTDINLASEEAARKRREFLIGQLGGASDSQFVPAGNAIFDDIGGFAQDFTQFLGNRGRNSGDTFFNQRPFRNSRAPRFNPRPLTQRR